MKYLHLQQVVALCKVYLIYLTSNLTSSPIIQYCMRLHDKPRPVVLKELRILLSYCVRPSHP